MQVSQLSWDGSVAMLCSLGGECRTSLVAALADRLLILRGSISADGSSISPRQLSVLEPLLHGWASLAAMGVLPGLHTRSCSVDYCVMGACPCTS